MSTKRLVLYTIDSQKYICRDTKNLYNKGCIRQDRGVL